jgi:hypothetical protein
MQTKQKSSQKQQKYSPEPVVRALLNPASRRALFERAGQILKARQAAWQQAQAISEIQTIDQLNGNQGRTERTLLVIAAIVVLLAGCGPKTEAEKAAAELKAKERIAEEREAVYNKESQKRAKANQEWFARNNYDLRVALTSLSVSGIPDPVVPSSPDRTAVFTFEGTVSNRTTNELAYVVVEVSITNPDAYNAAVCTEKVSIPLGLFPTASMSLGFPLKVSASQIPRCISQLSKWSWRWSLVSAIPVQDDSVLVAADLGSLIGKKD